MQARPLRADHMRQHIIMFRKDFSGDQRIVEARKEEKYLRNVLGIMRVNTLLSVMTVMRKYFTIQFYYPRTSSGLQTLFGEEDLKSTQRQCHETKLQRESNCFMKSSSVGLKKLMRKAANKSLHRIADKSGSR